MVAFTPIPSDAWTSAEEWSDENSPLSPILARLASRLDHVFQTSPPDAPGLLFVGAMSDGLGAASRALPRRISAGGVGTDFWEAAASCLGEAAERLSQSESPRKTRLAQNDEIVGTIGAESAGELFALAGNSPGDVVDCVEATILTSGQQVPIPVELTSDCSTAKAEMNISTGCAAGPTIEAAIYHGLLEWVERDAVATWWHGGVPARHIALETLDEAGVLGLITHSRQGQYGRQAWFLDVTTDLQIPCVVCVSLDRNGRGLAHGSAARATLGEAARAAFMEACQMEVASHLLAMKLKQAGAQLSDQDRNQLVRFGAISLHDCPLLVPQRPPLSPAGLGDVSAKGLATLLQTHGFLSLAVDVSSPRIGVPVAKTLVLGLQPLPATVRTERLRRPMESENGAPFALSLF